MPTPFKHQLIGAEFLAERTAALLADEQRVGKTGTAIIACDYVLARRILVVTKSSARANWGREFREWGYARKIQVIYKTSDIVDPEANVVVVGWGMIFHQHLYPQLEIGISERRRWDVMILDESHEAKNPEAKRTAIVYNKIARGADRVWCLSGTPIPNAPCDLWPMLSALARDKFPESYNQFVRNYCVTRKKYVGGQWIEYPIKGKNEPELKKRLEGFWLRRTQRDVGIKKPLYSVFPLHVDKLPAELDSIDAEAVLAAANAGERIDDMHLGVVRRVTGQIKAKAVVEAAREMLDDGLDKLVIMAWHSDVIDVIKNGLFEYGCVGIDGRTPPTHRQTMVDEFQRGRARVFVGNIQAAGEAIDLSSAAELWFAEASFTPKDMAQAAMRITNHSQKRQALVRFCALEGSIDEAVMAILTRKVASIKQIME